MFKYYFNLRNVLSVATSGFLIYDDKLIIPCQLQKLVINAVHRPHPGQLGTILLANVIWFPQIHPIIALRAENCRQCLEQRRNRKPLTPEAKLGPLPILKEPSEEIQLDFTGPIKDSSNPNIEHCRTTHKPEESET